MPTGTAARPTLCTLALLTLLLPRPAAGQWAPNGNAICAFPAEQANPIVVADGVGGAMIVWQDYRNGSSDLYVQRVNGSGNVVAGWPANGVALCTAPGDQKLPAVAPDGAGGLYVAWEDYRAGVDANVYLLRITAAGALVPGWPANGLALCIESGGQGYPAIVADGGGAIVAWQDDRSGAGSDIYAQRVSAAAIPQWVANGIPLCAADRNQLFPSIVGDGAGGAIVAWQDARSGTPDIYAQRVTGAGATLWAADGLAINTESYEQLTPRLVPDGAGGAVVVWDDYRDFSADIYAQRVTGAGTLLWAETGVPLCTDPAEQYGAPPVSDGAGGAIVPWIDYRGGSGDLYALRVAASGAIAPGWPASGAAVCTAAGDQFDVVATADGAGGVILAWGDARGGPSAIDLYAQHLSAAGQRVAGWPHNGLLVCNAPNNRLRPGIAGDGAGGAIVAWSDERNGPSDIYAKRLSASGSGTVGVPTPGPAFFALLPPAPNPMRGETTLRLRLERAEPVTLEVLDPGGRRVRLLAEGLLAAGPHALAWDGRDERGVPAGAGLYFAVLRTASGQIGVRKLTLLR